VLNQATLGCGLFREGYVRRAVDEGPISDACDWTRRWPEQLAAFDPDVVVVLTGAWDVADRQLPGRSDWVEPGDAAYGDALAAEAERAHELLTAEGAEVVWLSGPRVELGQLDGQPPLSSFPSSDPNRMRRHNAVVEAAVGAEPDVTWVDLFSWLEVQPGGATAADRRPDGVHFDDAGAAELADWLNPQLETIAEAAEPDPADEVAAPPPDQPTAPTTTVPPTAEVTVIGDSLSVGLHPAIRAGLDGHAGTTTHIGFGGLLYHPPGTAWEQELGDAERDVVVALFNTWENAALRSARPIDPGVPGWQDRYRTDYVEPFLADAARNAEHLIWVGMPRVRQAPIAAQQQELNAVWAAAAADDATVTWIDGAALLGGIDGVYLEVDDRTGEPVRLRATDGLHLCPDGAASLATAVFATIEELRGVQPRSGWASGDWDRDAEAYQWGGCPEVL